MEACSIPVHRCFRWRGGIYRVEEHLPDHFLMVKCLAKFWTPENFWVSSDYESERFNGYCHVSVDLSKDE